MVVNLDICFTHLAFRWASGRFFGLSQCWTNTTHSTCCSGLFCPSHVGTGWPPSKNCITWYIMGCFSVELLVFFLVTEWKRDVPDRVCQTTCVTWKVSSVCAKNSQGWHPGICEGDEALLAPWRQSAGTLGARQGQVWPRNCPQGHWDKGSLTR